MNAVKKTELSENSRISPEEYRKIKNRINYSGLKVYLSSRQKFVKEYVLYETQESEETLSTIIGKLVHVMLAGQEFNEQFAISSVQEPVGQMLELCQVLHKWYKREPEKEFERLFLDAVNEVKYDIDLKEKAFKGKTVEQILKLFSETDKKGCSPELFYRELVANSDKTVVTISQVQMAEKVVNIVKEHQYTRDIVNITPTDGIEVFNELPMLWMWKDIPCKGCVDRLVVDHITQTIQVYDWKLSWELEEFDRAYIKHKYWLQVGMYWIGVHEWALEHGYKDYKIEPMQYIAIDPMGNSAPIVYQLTQEDVKMALEGFSIRGYKWEGVVELLEVIEWHISTGNWRTTRAIEENNGVMKLEINYDKN